MVVIKCRQFEEWRSVNTISGLEASADSLMNGGTYTHFSRMEVSAESFMAVFKSSFKKEGECRQFQEGR